MIFPPQRYRLELVASCGSTNEDLLNQREAADFPERALLALRQTTGRGRRGRDWTTLEGNLALSVAFRASAATATLHSFLIGLAAKRALELFTEERVLLKWPNDIYLKGRKLAGILAQAKQSGPQVDLVVGIGLNLAQVPEELAGEAIALSAVVRNPPKPQEFALALLAELERLENEIEGFTDLRRLWERAAHLDAIELTIVGEEGKWRPLQLLESGELLVEQGGVKRSLASEEVSVRIV